MRIEKKIREAFKKEKKIREVSKWDSETQPNIYELANFLRKSGYRLLDILANNENTVYEILLEPVKPGHLYPEISHEVEEGKFYVNVLKYGMLEASDLEEVIKGYNNALSVVRHLESLDLGELEIEEESE